MVNLDYQSRTSIYEQIINEIERYVALGIYKPLQQLPSVRELASDLGINPNTVKKAYSELERKGVITTMSTKGTFVSEKVEEVVNMQVMQKIANIKDIISSLEKLGLTKEEIIRKIKN
jgi:GntR family transcriptional regulator